MAVVRFVPERKPAFYSITLSAGETWAGVAANGIRDKVHRPQPVGLLTNEFRTLESHSAEYFGDTRDYWWNPDYIELIGRRLAFGAAALIIGYMCALRSVAIASFVAGQQLRWVCGITGGWYTATRS